MGTAVAASPTKKVLKNCRISFPHVFQAHAMEEGQEKKYSVSLIISKDNTEVVEAINAAITYLEKEYKDKNKGKLPPKWKTPLRDGDEERPDDEAYKNAYFLNATSKTKPGVVNRLKEAITDEDTFYAGCYGHASVNFYTFEVSGNKGIACGLNNLMKTKDGERLAGKSSAEEDFADIEEEDDTDDLLG